jgi:short-subunit dehydrogenase
VVEICPGNVKTVFGESAVRGKESRRIAASVRRGITAERVAEAVLRAYQYDITETVVPWSNRLAIGLAFLAPFVINFALRRLLKGERKETT